MDYQQIAWLVFCAVAIVAAQSFCLSWVAPRLGVRDVNFLNGLRVVAISAVVAIAVFWVIDLLGIDPFIAAAPAFLAYLGAFAYLLHTEVGKAVGVWFLSLVLAGFCLGFIALLGFAAITFPDPAEWLCAAALALLCSAGCLIWAATSSHVEISFGEAFVTMLISFVSVGIWWILGYYVIGLSYWIVIPLVLPIHFLIVKVRLDMEFGRALLLIAGAGVAALALSFLLGLAAMGMAIPYFRGIVHGPSM